MSIYLKYTKFGESKDKIYCPIESCFVLALLNYMKIPSKIKVIFIRAIDSNPSFCVDIWNISYSLDSTVEGPVKYCQLPVYYDDEFYCIAGLCSVLRHIIKTDGSLINMLGFRGNCLSACAEQSSWTKFCEVDSVICVSNFIKGNNKWISHIQQLEQKLKQPLKVHNKVNIKDTENEKVSRYVDSEEFRLSDFILVLCVHLIFVHTSTALFDQFVLVKKWYDLVLTDLSLLKVLSMFSSEQLLEHNQVDIDVPVEIVDSSPMSKSQKARKFIARSDDAIKFVNSITPRIMQKGVGYGNEMHLDVADLPYFALPESGDLPPDRVERKLQQLTSMTKAVMKICSPGDVIVDFCCGGGHLGLLIAYLLPLCRVVLLDNKPESLSRAQRRAKELGLANLFIVQSNVDYFVGEFNIGACLHACGVASDLVMQTCVRYNASMVVSPCCYGKIQTCHTVSYPRSEWLQELGITSADHHLMSHCADRKSPDWMNWIDADRLEWAAEHGYNVYLGKLTPLECTPKNNMLIASKTKRLQSEEPGSRL